MGAWFPTFPTPARASTCKIPTRFPTSLSRLLSSNGAARRFCRVVWRKPTQMGVKFERSLADAANATLTPKADAQAAPAPDAAAAPAIVEAAKTE